MKFKLLILSALLLSIGSANTLAEETSYTSANKSVDVAAKEVPAGCATAEDDIAKLKEQKQSEGGLLSYLPVAIIADAVVSSDEETQKEAQTEANNDKIDAQIDEIKKNCDVQQSDFE